MVLHNWIDIWVVSCQISVCLSMSTSFSLFSNHLLVLPLQIFFVFLSLSLSLWEKNKDLVKMFYVYFFVWIYEKTGQKKFPIVSCSSVLILLLQIEIKRLHLSRMPLEDWQKQRGNLFEVEVLRWRRKRQSAADVHSCKFNQFQQQCRQDTERERDRGKTDGEKREKPFE